MLNLSHPQNLHPKICTYSYTVKNLDNILIYLHAPCMAIQYSSYSYCTNDRKNDWSSMPKVWWDNSITNTFRSLRAEITKSYCNTLPYAPGNRWALHVPSSCIVVATFWQLLNSSNELSRDMCYLEKKISTHLQHEDYLVIQWKTGSRWCYNLNHRIS